MGARGTSGNRLNPPARQVVATAGEAASEQTQSEGSIQPLLDLLWVQPRAGEGTADKAERRLHAERREQFGQFFGEAGQGVEQVRQAHEIVVAFHGVPVFGKGMLVGIALVLLDQEGAFDAPAIARLGCRNPP